MKLNLNIVFSLLFAFALILTFCSKNIPDDDAKKITDEYFKVAPIDDPTKFNQVSDQILEKIVQKYNISVSDYHKWLEEHPEYLEEIFKNIKKLGEEKARKDIQKLVDEGKKEISENTKKLLEDLEGNIEDIKDDAKKEIEEKSKKIDDIIDNK